jgi:hypothetical protein
MSTENKLSRLDDFYDPILLVKNAHVQTTTDDLANLFSDYVIVVECKKIRNRNDFVVTLQNIDDCKQIIRNFKGRQLDGKTMRFYLKLSGSNTYVKC